MSKLYSNPIDLNNGFHIVGAEALDDRTVWSEFSDIFVTAGSQKDAPMYNSVHKGMKVVIAEDGKEAKILLCKDETPYVPGVENAAVNEGNWTLYWTEVTKEISDYVHGTVDTSVNKVEKNYLISVADEVEKKGTSLYSDGVPTYDSSVWSTYKVKRNINGVESTFDIRTINKNFVTNIQQREDYLQSEINVINASIDNSSINFNGGSLKKDLALLTDHGSLPAGMTVAQLEALTISEILRKILFETAAPKSVRNAGATITWNNSAFKTTVDVGHAAPVEADFGHTYQSEQWNWTSKDGTKTGTAVSLSTKGDVKYFYNANSTTNKNGTGVGTAPVAAEGTNGYWYATIGQVAGSKAVDSLGNTKNEAGVTYKDVRTDTLTSSNYLSYYGGWRIYTNANVLSTDGSSTWNKRSTNPGAYAGTATQSKSTFFAHNADESSVNRYKTFYMQWPAATTDAQSFFVYVPDSRQIASVKGANPTATNVWDIDAAATLVGTVNIVNDFGVSGTFKKYSISKSAGITTVKVVLS